jgi:hypothetical protein
MKRCSIALAAQYDFKVQRDERTFAENLLHVAAVDYDLIGRVSGSKSGPDFGKDKHNPSRDQLVVYYRHLDFEGLRTDGRECFTGNGIEVARRIAERDSGCALRGVDDRDDVARDLRHIVGEPGISSGICDFACRGAQLVVDGAFTGTGDGHHWPKPLRRNLLPDFHPGIAGFFLDFQTVADALAWTQSKDYAGMSNERDQRATCAMRFDFDSDYAVAEVV